MGAYSSGLIRLLSRGLAKLQAKVTLAGPVLALLAVVEPARVVYLLFCPTTTN